MPKLANLEIKRVIKIKAWFSAKDWCLYDVEYANVAAKDLNQTLEEYVNRGESKEAIYMVMHSLMRHHAERGANDTEPRAFLDRVLAEIYKE